MNQQPLFLAPNAEKRRGMRSQNPSPEQYESLALTRLSKNFILRDLLFSTESAARGFSNYPEDPDMVIRAGRALCEKVLEPVQAQWGKCFVTFGYQSREGIEYGMPKAKRAANPRSSNPHMWDRKSWGELIYARCDILPACVEDGDVSKHEFGHWILMNLDICLLMNWTRSNGSCITISPKPRRVWLEWGNPLNGEPKQRIIWGTHFWQHVYPGLPADKRPKYGPSCTGGRMQWRQSDFIMGERPG